MAGQTLQTTSKEAWALARRQHGVLTRSQLLGLGLTAAAIDHRIAAGRLYPASRGVYAVGRPQLTRFGRWMAAVLACGPDALLSHGSAAAMWEIGVERRGEIELTVPANVSRSRTGTRLHRRTTLSPADKTQHQGIPVTTPTCTLIDLASYLPPSQLEAAVSAADKRGLTNPEALRAAAEGLDHRRPGVASLRQTLDRRTFRLTDSELERRFLAIVRKAGLPLPETGRIANGFKVDFYWPDLGLVVETDGLRYHRTPTQQAKDRVRDQAHAAAGLTSLRFTHAQVRFEPAYVAATLAAVARRLPAAHRLF